MAILTMRLTTALLTATMDRTGFPAASFSEQVPGSMVVTASMGTLITASTHIMGTVGLCRDAGSQLLEASTEMRPAMGKGMSAMPAMNPAASIMQGLLVMAAAAMAAKDTANYV